MYDRASDEVSGKSNPDRYVVLIYDIATLGLKLKSVVMYP